MIFMLCFFLKKKRKKEQAAYGLGLDRHEALGFQSNGPSVLNDNKTIGKTEHPSVVLVS
jgi:hypothetical protein